MKDSDKKAKVAMSSVFGGLFLTIMKGIVGFLTGSLGILSEALHSLLDLGSAVLTYFAVKVGDKPADKEHPYGHSKVESVSALIESALLFVTSGWIIYEAVRRLFFKQVEIEVTWYAILVIIISIIVDISRSRALMKVAKETKSQALEADALHFSSDIWSSGAVLVGLIASYFKVPAADTVAALVVALVVLRAGYKLAKRTFDVLIDTAPEGVSDIINEIAGKVEGVIKVSNVRARPAGASMFVELSVEVSRKLALEKVKKISKEVEEQIKTKIKEADITVHVVPVALSSETVSEHVQILAHSHELSIHDIAVHLVGDKTYINFDLEVPAGLSMEEAHAKSTHLEELLKSELGPDVEIVTHIEPLKHDIVSGKKIDKEKEKIIKNEIEVISKSLEYIKNPHEIEVRSVDDRIFISFHAYVDPNAKIEDSHEESSKFEYLIKQKIPNVSRTLIHLEPKE